MTERIDHAAKSEEINEYIGENFIAEEGWTDTTAILGGIDSLRHAVLALVEQQRVGNMIALIASTARGVAEGQHTASAYLELYRKVNPAVTAALGLGEAK